jgi:hypothetical protein
MQFTFGKAPYFEVASQHILRLKMAPDLSLLPMPLLPKKLHTWSVVR